MKPEEQRKAIADFCKWQNTQCERVFAVLMEDLTVHCIDPINDLNAMFEAEKFLTNSERIAHAQHLQDLMGWHCVGIVPDYPRDLTALSRIAGASAKIRAEAFLRTIGKWTE